MRNNAQLLAKSASFLCIATLITGPLMLGSYYDHWRLPLLYCATGTILFTFLYVLASKNGSHKTTGTVLSLSVLALSAQGLFMWYNTWGEFHVDHSMAGRFKNWNLSQLKDQPFYHLPGAPDAKQAFDRLSYIIPALCLIASTRCLIARRVLSLSKFSAAIFWTGTTVAALGLIQRFTGAKSVLWCDALFDPRFPLFFGTFRSPGIASCYLNLSLAVGLSLLLATTHSLTKQKKATPTMPILLSIGIIITVAAAASTGSKAGVAFTALTIILWVLVNFRALIRTFKRSTALFPSGSPHERNIIIGAILGALALATLSFGGLVYQRWEYAEAANFDTLDARQTTNNIQVDMISDPQWGPLGFGPGSFYPMFPFYSNNDGTKKIQAVWVYAHNDHLQTLVEWGWLGTGFFIILIGGGGTILLVEQFAYRKNHRTQHIYYFRGFSIAMLVCLLHATVDFPFQIESIALTFSCILGAAWAGKSLRSH